MTKTLLSLRRDETGFVLSAELILIATVVTLGLVVGLAEMSNAVNGEMDDMAGAVEGMSQDAWYDGGDDWSSDEAAFDHTGGH